MEYRHLFWALVPILWLLPSLGWLKMAAWKATAAALFLAAAISLLVFDMPAVHAGGALLEGILLALFPIIWVVVSALFVYRISVASGGMETIRHMLMGLSPDRRMQTLVIAFAFGGFLEAVAGFGTAVAIPAGIMIAMGFEPLLAAVVCLIANTIPVAFGVLGVPVVTLAQVTGMQSGPLSIYTALQLIPLVLVLPVGLVAMTTGSLKAVRGVALPAVLAGAVFGAAQLLVAWRLGPEMPAVIGSICAMLFLVGWARWRPVKDVWRFPGEAADAVRHEKTPRPQILRAWSPFLLVLLLIVVTRAVPFLVPLLARPPFTVHLQTYYGSGGKALAFPLAASGGTLLFISAVVGGMIQRLPPSRIVGVFAETLRISWKSILTILCIVAMAKLMGYSGMVACIAAAFAMTGPLFPFLSPFIGALGTFLTGSDTSSNVLFGGLQKTTAQNLSLSTDWMVAANASGATAGKMISPQSISIAASSTGLSGREGELLRRTLPWCVAYVAVMGVIVWLGAKFLT